MQATLLPPHLQAWKLAFALSGVAGLTFLNLRGVKESSADVRRVTALKGTLPEGVELLVGVDDALVEGVQAGATGWIAGLVNAFPAESVELFELSRAGRMEEAARRY